ncbi:ubiquitin carboxyl-terminal hydrolase [Neochlamydia sp. EPS4]|uniref:ubiquitin carboxyl-terminal hydrolase n=1 Tax=Neochlamydia sp. EPS4 TaxID=1478175 RepID=UPI00138E16E0|nr:ubiquitin carboxyl-terminal hydrolase [Neochlamydia sp. EPS4]
MVKKIKVENTTQKVKQAWELFALTTNDGWQVVKSYADFQAPIKWALRVMDPKLTSTETKSLAGHQDSSTETYHQEYALKEHETATVWHYFKGFGTHFKLGSSLYNPEYKLSAFTQPKSKKGLKKEKVSKISVDVGVGRIIIGSSMTMQQHIEILKHLACISRGDDTYRSEENKQVKEEDDTAFRYLENIQNVEEALVPTLNNALLILVWEYYKNKQPIGELYFVHRYYKDFYRSGEFTLMYEKENKISYQYRPSLNEILETLRFLFGQIATFEEFATKFSRVKLKFNRKNPYFALKEFIHGEMRYKGNVFFRIDGLWLQIKADHLAVLQRAFYILIDKHLIDTKDPQASGQLGKPWLAKKEWATFTAELALEKTEVQEKQLKNYLEELCKREFCFINEKGVVIYPTPTRCLLENEGMPANFTKAVSKNWEGLSLLLTDKKDRKEVLKPQELGVFFSKKNSEEYAKDLFKLLQKKYPVLSRLSGNAKKICILREDGTPTLSDLSAFIFKGINLKNNKKAIGKLLTEKMKNNHACEINDFKERLNIKERFAKAIFKELSKPIPMPEQKLYGSRYLMQGPLPAYFEASEPLIDFLNEQHNNYKLVLQEEGYNRLYLETPGFLVCDQVYAGKREKVELFDLLKFGKDEEDLYLYHVKEGFAQPTRIACAQIREAAINVLNARVGKAEMLRKLYYQVIDVKDASPFRQKLKKSFKALPLVENENDPSDRFVQLFKRDLNKICFVYAFIDSAEGAERFLIDEKNPGYEFRKEDFDKLSSQKSSSSTKLYKFLKSQEYLDKYGRVGDKFLRLIKEEFCAEMLEGGWSHKIAGKVYERVHQQLSQFDSMVAKIELLHLEEFLKLKGFGFKICQIPRSANIDVSKPGFFQWSSLSQKKWRAASLPLDASFKYEDQVYHRSEKAINLLGVLASLFELSMEQVNEKELRLKMCKLFLKKKSADRKIFLDYFSKLSEKFKNKSKTEINSFSLSPKLNLLLQNKSQNFEKSFEEIFTSYLDSLIYSTFLLEHEELELVAMLLDRKIVFLAQNREKIVNSRKPLKVINLNGKQRVIYIQEGLLYYPCQSPEKTHATSDIESDIDSDSLEEISAENSEEKYSLSLTQERQSEILSNLGSVGIINVNNDCFFISAMQLLFHTPLLLHLVDEKNLENKKNLKKLGKKTLNAQQLRGLLLEMALEYGIESDSCASNLNSERDAMVTFSRQKMRTLLGFSTNGQEDAAEAIVKTCEHYNMASWNSTFTRSRQVNLAKKKSVKGKKIENYSKINAKDKIENFEETFILPLTISDKTENLQDMINELFCSHKENAELTFVQNGKVYIVNNYREQLNIVNMKEIIFFQIMRFQPAEDGNGFIKVVKSININKQIKIGQQKYTLKGFIVHKGDTKNTGHYLAYCLTSKGWQLFEDGKKPQRLDEDEILNEAKEGYIFYYHKINN